MVSNLFHMREQEKKWRTISCFISIIIMFILQNFSHLWQEFVLIDILIVTYRKIIMGISLCINRSIFGLSAHTHTQKQTLFIRICVCVRSKKKITETYYQDIINVNKNYMTFLIECLQIFFYETTKLLLQAQDCRIGFNFFIQVRLLFSKLESFFNSQFVCSVFVCACVSPSEWRITESSFFFF